MTLCDIWNRMVPDSTRVLREQIKEKSVKTYDKYDYYAKNAFYHRLTRVVVLFTSALETVDIKFERILEAVLFIKPKPEDLHAFIIARGLLLVPFIILLTHKILPLQ